MNGHKVEFIYLFIYIKKNKLNNQQQLHFETINVKIFHAVQNYLKWNFKY